METSTLDFLPILCASIYLFHYFKTETKGLEQGTKFLDSFTQTLQYKSSESQKEHSDQECFHCGLEQ
jgi:hypothetical protein